MRCFLIITFSITGTAWISLAVLTQLSVISFTHSVGSVLHFIGGFGPTIASLFLMNEKLTLHSFKKFVFQYKKKSMIYLWVMAAMAIAAIGLSSREFNSELPVHLVPIIFIQAVFIYGGEEELGWRGIMQSLLEEKYKFSIATIILGIVWGIWHIPLWFVEETSQ